ncbi:MULTISPECIES: DUF7344 domain-containing protein [Haloprofundus]|uniref:DUF7344 domain-containing protein n=1 Tax=Haloprofundus TaxID=1911573 RepID=UPI000E444E7A|nr:MULTISPECIES: hypothetical protein [Haloprofundus]QCJ46666.1 hypothetical protein FCF25_05830 [Haloprofundus sp. MHR1]
MQLRQRTVPEYEIHTVLSNQRRRVALEHLGSGPGRTTVRELSEVVATAETGESPPPRNVRESVYISLHQTHLPKLHDLGVVDYDRERKEIRLLEGARDVDLYMEVVTKHGITWGEYYRGLGVLSLLTVVAASIGVPGLSLAAPVLWASAFLALFACSTLYQLWARRWQVFRALR